MRKFNITVNGRQYEVEVEEIGGVVTSAAPVVSASAPAPAKAAEPAAAAPAPKAEAPKAPVSVPSGSETITCPMPGTIVQVKFNEGDTVKKGDVLFILEAMKMENEIMAPRDGKVTKIGVAKGASVNTGDLLAVLA